MTRYSADSREPGMYRELFVDHAIILRHREASSFCSPCYHKTGLSVPSKSLGWLFKSRTGAVVREYIGKIKVQTTLYGSRGSDQLFVVIEQFAV